MKLESFKEKNTKKTTIIIFTACCILLITMAFFYSSFALFEEKKDFNIIDGSVDDPKDLYFAYYINNVLTTEPPSKETNYALSRDSNCTNGVTVTWDMYNWQAIVNYDNYTKETNSIVKCNLYFTNGLFSDIITSCGMGGTNAGECLKTYKQKESKLQEDNTKDNNLRYIEANPSNYVSFNNELWRIIGVMNNVDDGSGKKESRLKIIRDESLGDFTWDSSLEEVNTGAGVNEWSQSDIMKLLNPGFENESVGGSLYWNKQSGTCYNRDMNATKTCDFTSTGLTSEAKNMIDDAVWYTGSNGTEAQTTILTSRFYELEQSNNTGKICDGSDGFCQDAVTRTTTWTGTVGLMSPSDYGFATGGGTSCLNAALNKWSDSSLALCKDNDWLYKSDHSQWTINPKADSQNATYEFRVTNNGNVVGTLCVMPSGIHPSVYLKKNIKIIDGTGSRDLPFKLSL